MRFSNATSIPGRTPAPLPRKGAVSLPLPKVQSPAPGKARPREG
jgi:hypothetical protein